MDSLTEKRFEDTVFEALGSSPMYQGFRGLPAFDHTTCVWREELATFIQETQPGEWAKLSRQFPDKETEALCTELHTARQRRGILELLREGLTIRGANLRLTYFRPSGNMAPEHGRKYERNRFTLVRQFHHDPHTPAESTDLVILLNGIPIVTFELKNQYTKQNVSHGRDQYCKRSPNNLFLRSCLVHFAVDHNDVLMTTKLEGKDTRFLPFNRDTKNPVIEGKYATSYLWDDVLRADSLLNLLQNFLQEEKDKNTGAVRMIFPRYHQLDVVRQLLKKVREDGAGHHYLIQHSAGSGKSKSIAWLSHQLSVLRDASGDSMIFDGVIVITDRRVLDKQLREDVKNFEKINDYVAAAKDNAKQLMDAIERGSKIIVSTLQKFGFISDLDKGKLAGKRFAIIVDEAHSSQTGENVRDLKASLTTPEALEKLIREDDENLDVDPLTDELEKMMKSRQQMPHLSFFAFTATPKRKTLELFGTPVSTDGMGKKTDYNAFHVYSMRQAIEEGFIIDVLQNYITLNTYFELNTKEQADPNFQNEKRKIRRLLMELVSKEPNAIHRRAHLMLDHFNTHTIHKIRGQAKAMVVTASRVHAVLYKLAFDEICRETYPHIKTLVAFSGTVELNDRKYTEENMNGTGAKDIADTFKLPEYKILIVANKFQTGFDQPLLHTMYVAKRLGGVNTIQTLSRLNRTMPGKTDTMILDFENDRDAVQRDFQDYYQRTGLLEGSDPQKLYNLWYELQDLDVFDKEDVDKFGKYFVEEKKSGEVLSPMFKRLVDERYLMLDSGDREKFRKTAQQYVRQYAFLSQVITFVDKDLELLHLFLKLLITYLPYERISLPVEVLSMVDMEKYRIQEEANGSILLHTVDVAMDPDGGTGIKQSVQGPVDTLANVVKELNDLYEYPFEEADIVFRGLREKLVKNEGLVASFKADNTEDVKREKLKQSVNDALLENGEVFLSFMAKMDEDKSFGNFVLAQMFKWFQEQAKGQ